METMTTETPKKARRALASSDAPVTLKTLSAYLGLTRGTISLVLNSAPGSEAIPEATKQRIFRAAREFDYKPNYFARYLNSKRSYLIGVMATSLAEGYDSAVLAGIERKLVESEYDYFVASHHWSKAIIRRTLNTLAERGAEGLILINTDPPDLEGGLPLIAFGAGKPRKDLSRISIDNAVGARLMVQHLAELGHRSVAVFRGHKDSLDTPDRWEGVYAAAAEFGLTIDLAATVQLGRIGNADLSGIEEGIEAAKLLLDRKGNFTALLAFNDISAIGALIAFRNVGKRVPEDISVIGFDDISLGRITTPMLTTIRQPLLQMGEMAAANILKQIEEKARPPAQTSIEPSLVVRESTGPPPSAGSRIW